MHPPAPFTYTASSVPFHLLPNLPFGNGVNELMTCCSFVSQTPMQTHKLGQSRVSNVRFHATVDGKVDWVVCNWSALDPARRVIHTCMIQHNVNNTSEQTSEHACDHVATNLSINLLPRKASMRARVADDTCCPHIMTTRAVSSAPPAAKPSPVPSPVTSTVPSAVPSVVRRFSADMG